MRYTIRVIKDGNVIYEKQNLDELNSIVLPAELKMKYPEEFENGRLKIEVDVIKEA